MKKTILCSLVLIFSLAIFAQDFSVPTNYKLEAPADFKTYEPDMLNGLDWLITTPITTELDKRKNVNTFVLAWMMGSPDVTIEVTQEVVTFLECDQCLMIFMGGWAKYAVQNNYSNDKVMGNFSGVESVIQFYKNNQGKMPKNTGIEKYMKLQEKGKLKKHIKSKV